jgi:hypothetical protein
MRRAIPARRWLPALLAVAVSVPLAACDDSVSDLGNQVIATIAGYTMSAADSGPLDRGTASQSLPTQAAQTASALDAAGFRGGYSRIFLRGGAAAGDYVLVSVYAMASAESSTRFLASERGALQSTGTVVLFSATGVADSVGFTLTGPTQRGDRQVFCDGVAFAKGARVYAVTTCSATPEDSRLAVDVAQQQARAG